MYLFTTSPISMRHSSWSLASKDFLMCLPNPDIEISTSSSGLLRREVIISHVIDNSRILGLVSGMLLPPSFSLSFEFSLVFSPDGSVFTFVFFPLTPLVLDVLQNSRLSKLYHALAMIYMLAKNISNAPKTKPKVEQQTEFKRKHFQIVSIQKYVFKYNL